VQAITVVQQSDDNAGVEQRRHSDLVILINSSAVIVGRNIFLLEFTDRLGRLLPDKIVDIKVVEFIWEQEVESCVIREQSAGARDRLQNSRIRGMDGSARTRSFARKFSISCIRTRVSSSVCSSEKQIRGRRMPNKDEQGA